MKFVRVFSVAFLLTCCFAKAQEVKNVTAEQDGNNINIYYDLAGARDFQVFTISALCENGAKKFTLKHVSGDVGENVKGGPGKKIVWDVFKDVDSVGNATFIVRIDKVTDTRPKDAPKKTCGCLAFTKGH